MNLRRCFLLLARPGRAPLAVLPELAMLLALPTGAGAMLNTVCAGAGLANGVPYMGASMLARDGKHFTSFSFPDKVWFPRRLR